MDAHVVRGLDDDRSAMVYKCSNISFAAAASGGWLLRNASEYRRRASGQDRTEYGTEHTQIGPKVVIEARPAQDRGVGGELIVATNCRSPSARWW